MDIQSTFFLFLLFYLGYAQNDCPPAYCSKNNFEIWPPFWLERQQPQSCGSPGFNLSCNDQGKTVLNLPQSGDFYVFSIYYYIRIITLYDPKNCLPSRLLSLNLSSSPFTAVYYQNYTFLSCPKDQGSALNTIDCMSNDTVSVLATTDQDEVERMYMCKTIAVSKIPVSSEYNFSFDNLFPTYLELTWNVSNCKRCGSANGGPPSQGIKNTRPIFRVIALSFLIPSLVIPALIIGISCCICMLKRDNNQGNNATQNSRTSTTLNAVTRGLDESIIESYKKVTLGDNRRITGPNDLTCPICLADYEPKEIIRFIPNCEHCFHAECIDKWLKLNNKCPICRTSLLSVPNMV